MKAIGELQADGYGIAVFSPKKLNAFLAARKCRAKKYLSYFDKHKDLFFDLIKEGIWLPFYRICRFEYETYVCVDEKIVIPEGYNVVYHYPNFFITVEDKLCFSSFSFLEYHKDMIDRNETDLGRETPSGPDEILEWYNDAIGIELETGNYRFDLYGLKRIDELKRESKNFAFLFAFRRTDETTNENLDKCDNDKYNFDIRSATN